MSASLLALHYLPSIHWFAVYLQSEQVWVERCESFVKSSARNRCHFSSAAGVQLLTIPIQGGRDHHQLYHNTLVANTGHWQKKHWHSIQSAYASTPFFDYYAYRLEVFYQQPCENLFQFNCGLLTVLLGMLKTENKHRFTETFEKVPGRLTDFRYSSEDSALQFPPYYQIFSDRHGFMPNLSIIDLLFHLGPQAKDYLLDLKVLC